MQFDLPQERHRLHLMGGCLLVFVLLLGGCEAFRGLIGFRHYQQVGPADHSETLRRFNAEPRKGRSDREVFGNLMREKLSGLSTEEAVAWLEADNFVCEHHICVLNRVTRSDVHPVQPELDGVIFVASFVVVINAEKIEAADDLDVAIVSSDHREY